MNENQLYTILCEEHIKRYKIISCGVFKKEFEILRDNIPDGVEITEVWLEQGLHRDPDKLNTLIKDEIAATEANDEQFDAIMLVYGICSKGTVGVSSEKYTIVVPRAHDCITLFLGSKERYLDEFSKTPGTYWYTPGFISGSMQPGMSEKYSGIYQQFEENYEDYLEKFGDEELAHYVVEQQEQAWIKNYSRGAYVESGLREGDALKKKAKAFCESRDWDFEEIKGDFALLQDLISGNWDDERFLILKPGETLAIGGVNEIITAYGIEDEKSFIGEDYELSLLYDGFFRDLPKPSVISPNGSIDTVIGIDAGGTYTDAVVVSLKNSRVMSSAKSPTTHHDLSIGMRKALDKLNPDEIEQASRIAISTTLATNAIVEEKGARTGLLLIGYDDKTASMITVGNRDIKMTVSGCHDIYGTETTALDEKKLIKAARSMVKLGVEAIAVSSYMAPRNPEHEMKARELLSGILSLPIVTGHDLTDDIDSVRRAHTVLLNARLLPVISGLVESVGQVVDDLNLPHDVRLVTTDGTLMNINEALEMPVRLVLSGPAASVKGVRFLTNVDSCLLIDMGGTTSDIAVIENGSAKRSGRGAIVGSYKTSIRATDIRTLGLGGDSGISWLNNRVTVGPQRMVPVSVLATEHPEIEDNLLNLKGYQASDYGLVQPGTHYILVRTPDNDEFLNERERQILEILSHRPHSVVELAEKLVYPYLSLLGTERLEELGYVRKCGLTPTDILVSEKAIDLWSSQSADIMIDLFAERSSLGKDEFVSECWAEIHRMAASSLITEALAGGEETKSFPGCKFCSDGFEQNSSLEVNYKLKHPLVGIGAPAHLLLENLGSYLDAEKVFPKDAEVANAVGAASGAGGMHLDMTIMQDSRGRFNLFSPEGIHHYSDLETAKEEAVALSKSCALAYSKRMSYSLFTLDIHIRDRSAPTAFDSEIYIDTSIVATMKY